LTFRPEFGRRSSADTCPETIRSNVSFAEALEALGVYCHWKRSTSRRAKPSGAGERVCYAVENPLGTTDFLNVLGIEPEPLLKGVIRTAVVAALINVGPSFKKIASA
jgi:hypothetical protein